MWNKLLLVAGTLTALGSPAIGTDARADEVTIGYLQIVEPAKVAQVDGSYEKDSGWTVNWRKFDSGADILAAITTDAVQLAYIGSPPFAAAASREVPIELFLIAGQIGDAEALVTREGAGIAAPTDLPGKKVAVTFATTTHYSLLSALQKWGIDPGTVEIVNMRPPEIAAAWQRGDIDAAYVWNPILGALKKNGTVLVTSAQVAEWGSPTFDAWMVRKDFAESHPDFMKSFVDTTFKAYADFLKNHAGWTESSAEVLKIAEITGASPAEVLELLAGNYFPAPAEAASPRFLGGGATKAIADTAAFLKAQGAIQAILPDYAPYINASFAEAWKASH